MEPTTIAAIVGGAASLAKGLFSDRSAEKAAHINADLQREFAQSGIRWKVADARAAGIHPLYALGASTHAASPVAVGGSGIGDALGDIGQDVSRSIEATATRSERQAAQQEALRFDRAAERNRNDALAAQLALQAVDRAEAKAAAQRAEARADAELASRLLNDEAQRNMWASVDARNRQQRGPGMPESVSSVGATKVKPVEIPSRAIGDPHKLAGTQPTFITTEVAPGQYIDMLNPDVHQDPGEVIGFLAGASAYIKKWLYEAGATQQHYQGALSQAQAAHYRRKSNEMRNLHPGYPRRAGR